MSDDERMSSATGSSRQRHQTLTAILTATRMD